MTATTRTTDNKTLPPDPPTNPAAEQEPKQPHSEPTLEKAIDDETGGLLNPSRDDKRTDLPAKDE